MQHYMPVATSSHLVVWQLIAGRIQTILIMRLTGVTCLFTMGLHPSLWRITWFIVPIVLLRSGALSMPSPAPQSPSSTCRRKRTTGTFAWQA